MKKWSGVALVLVLFLTLLTSCGKAAKSENEIRDDLQDYLCKVLERQDAVLDRISITKRQTDKAAKSDVIYVDYWLKTKDQTIEASGKSEMRYGLYNDGWILDDVEVTQNSFSPLVGTSYTEDELRAYITDWYGYGKDSKSSTITLIDHTTDLENGADMYTVEMENEYEYMTERLSVDILFTFDGDYGGTWTIYSVSADTVEENWEKLLCMIDGYEITCFDLTNVGANMAYTRWTKTNMSPDVPVPWRNYSISLEKAEQTNATECFVKGSSYISFYYLTYGYTIVLDNVRWTDIRYYNMGGFTGNYNTADDCWLVSKNHIYTYANTYLDNYNKQVHIVLREATRID